MNDQAKTKIFRLRVNRFDPQKTFYIPVLNENGFEIEFQCKEGTKPEVKRLKELP